MGKIILDYDYVIADFICPRPRLRRLFSPHYIIWMDTIEEDIVRKWSLFQ